MEAEKRYRPLWRVPFKLLYWPQVIHLLLLSSLVLCGNLARVKEHQRVNSWSNDAGHAGALIYTLMPFLHQEARLFSHLCMHELCMHVKSTYIYIYTYVNTHTGIHAHLYSSICACTYVNIHTCIYMHACMHACMHAYVHTYMHLCMCVYVCMYVCRHACMHACRQAGRQVGR